MPELDNQTANKPWLKDIYLNFMGKLFRKNVGEMTCVRRELQVFVYSVYKSRIVINYVDTRP